MSSLRPSMSRILAQARRFARDERGVTAIEFGALALPFFTIILAIIQTAVMLLATQVLDSALEDASRRVRTGEAAAYTPSQFRDYMCASTFNLLDCSQIQIRSEVLATGFGAVTINPTVEDCTTSTCTFRASWPAYDPGKCAQVVQISAYYRYPLIVVLPYFNLKNQPDNYRLINAIRVFRNEPC